MMQCHSALFVSLIAVLGFQSEGPSRRDASGMQDHQKSELLLLRRVRQVHHPQLHVRPLHRWNGNPLHLRPDAASAATAPHRLPGQDSGRD